MKNRIRMARAAVSLTQEELARRVGVSRQAINHIENGKYLPSVALAMKIAKELGMRVEELFFEEQ
ncbi:MAG TPA: helix-turn-helix transcriptional regulator [Bacteroidales bacterium]|nr:helix-turn-helix transcriptional regulator [Bacteroidales bacterium]